MFNLIDKSQIFSRDKCTTVGDEAVWCMAILCMATGVKIWIL